MKETRRLGRGTVGWAKYAHEGERDDELNFPEGAEIFHIDHSYYEQWLGTYEGRRGWFPPICVGFCAYSCPPCRTLLSDHSSLDQLVSDAGIDLRTRKQDFRRALEKGCGICAALYETIKEHGTAESAQSFLVLEREECTEETEDTEDDRQELVRNYRATTTSESGPYDLQAVYVSPSGVESKDECSTAAWFNVYADYDDLATDYISARPIVPISSATLDTAKRWIDQCLSLHDQCPGPEPSPLPTRVIDVGAADGSSEPKLLLSNGQPDRYAALSYCWGGLQPVILTVNTIDSMQQSISMSDLPATIQDAITVTRLLDLRYLWVDALCIIQDSDSDKAIEVARMDQIYNDAFLTICAAGPKKSSVSFLDQNFPPSGTNPYRVGSLRFPCPDGRWGNILVEERWHHQVARESLSRRAWALQERFLSRRVLVFSNIQMYWRCQTELRCDGGYAFNYMEKWATRPSFLFQCKDKGEIEVDRTEIYDNWLEIVGDYNGRQLSLHKDKLPALSGIATRFQHVLGDTYCAGLWRNDLLLGLAWQVDDPYLTSRMSQYRAPTWSWASLDGDISWQFNRDAPPGVNHEVAWQTKVVRCDVQLVFPSAPFGEVQGGIIELSGYVKDFIWDGSKHLLIEGTNPDIDTDGGSDSDHYGEDKVRIYADFADDLTADGGPSKITEPNVFRIGDLRERTTVKGRCVSGIPVTHAYVLMLEQQSDGKYVRLGLIDFAPWWKMGEFFEGCTQRTIVIR